MDLLTVRNFEDVKRDAKVFFGARIVMVNSEMRAWQVKNGKLVDVSLVCNVSSMPVDFLRDTVVSWLSSIVDDRSLTIFKWIQKKLENTRWSLGLSTYGYFGVLKFDYAGHEWQESIYGEGLYEIPVTPEAVLDLYDFLVNDAHHDTIPLHIGSYQSFFPITSE